MQFLSHALVYAISRSLECVQTEFFPGTHAVAAAARVLDGEAAPSISPQLQAGDAVIYDGE